MGTRKGSKPKKTYLTGSYFERLQTNPLKVLRIIRRIVDNFGEEPEHIVKIAAYCKVDEKTAFGLIHSFIHQQESNVRTEKVLKELEKKKIENEKVDVFVKEKEKMMS